MFQRITRLVNACLFGLPSWIKGVFSRKNLDLFPGALPPNPGIPKNDVSGLSYFRAGPSEERGRLDNSILTIKRLRKLGMQLLITIFILLLGWVSLRIFLLILIWIEKIINFIEPFIF